MCREKKTGSQCLNEKIGWPRLCLKLNWPWPGGILVCLYWLCNANRLASWLPRIPAFSFQVAIAEICAWVHKNLNSSDPLCLTRQRIVHGHLLRANIAQQTCDTLRPQSCDDASQWISDSRRANIHTFARHDHMLAFRAVHGSRQFCQLAVCSYGRKLEIYSCKFEISHMSIFTINFVLRLLVVL